jgi:polyhydroxyalkanoate synthesis regulator phasin
VSLARQLLEEFSKDNEAYQEFIRRISVGIAQDDKVRLLILDSVIKEVATKSDIDALRKEINDLEQRLRTATKSDIDALRKEINDLEQRLRTATKSDIDALRKEMRDTEQGIKTELKSYVDVKFESVNKRIDEIREDMRTYFFGFLGGILATLIAIILTKVF